MIMTHEAAARERESNNLPNTVNIVLRNSVIVSVYYSNTKANKEKDRVNKIFDNPNLCNVLELVVEDYHE